MNIMTAVGLCDGALVAGCRLGFGVGFLVGLVVWGIINGLFWVSTIDCVGYLVGCGVDIGVGEIVAVQRTLSSKLHADMLSSKSLPV